MKYSLTTLIFVMAVALSCSKTPRLSCSPEINAWAIDNVDYYETVCRDEFIELPLSKQRAVYVGVTGKKKVQLWQEKLDMVILEGGGSTCDGICK
ncbi:MAG: hypothetical protein NC308_06860 [Clostridium sp.]|nr:hypothetical protein [Bacteroides sp.]MCM1198591.1 hypothetical protein [Clostridium sp.]